MQQYICSTQLPAQEVIFSEIKEDIIRSENFFHRHRKEIIHCFSGILFSVVLLIIFLWLTRLLQKYLPPRKVTWKREISGTLLLPLGLLAAEFFSLMFSIPLLKTLPEKAEVLIIRLFYTGFAITIAWGLLRIVSVIDRQIRHLAEKRDNALDNLTVGILGSILKAAILLTVFLFIGQNIFDINISALLASAGVIGLAFALAAKDTVSNFFGTLVIVADTPFRIGDRIECGTVCGIVREVGMRSSKIITDDGTRCTIPNSILTNAAVFQRNRKGHLKRVIDLALTYDTTPENMDKALKLLHNIMDDFHGQDQPDFVPRIYFSSFGSYSLNIRAIIFFKTESFEEEERLLNELNFTILKEFNSAGLQFAYPTQTVFIQGNLP